MQDKDIVWFSEVDKEDVGLVGGKGANLGELSKINIPIPNGFIVTSSAYFKNLDKSGALDRIKGTLYDLDVENPTQLQIKAEACQKEIRNTDLDSKLEKTLYEFYNKLKGSKNTFVAVRSSATAEDLPEASFAGQQSTFLNVKNNKGLKSALLDVWASLFEARAIFYRASKNYDHFKVKIAVVVQLMIHSEASGVMFTIDPVTNDKRKITVEAVFGLGELIVAGRETPDHYEVDKKTFKIESKNIAAQLKQQVSTKTGNKLIEISRSHKKDQKLEDEFIIKLAKMGIQIEKHYFFPQDIEWAFAKNQLYIVQTRPVTTVKEKEHEAELKRRNVPEKRNILLQGAPASPVIGTGKVVLVPSPKDIFKVHKGDVLVTVMTNPDFVPAMKKAIAIVTDKGGRTSHAAIISRELGIACVVGTQKATKILKEGTIVTVDGSKGIIYKGQLTTAGKDQKYTKKSHLEVPRKTATRLYVNMAQPDLASKVAAKNVDGVGLLRAEFILAQIGIHPKKFIEEKKSSKFIDQLASSLAIFGKAFGDKPVIYRSTDLKTNEYRNLKGGDKYEPKEFNPLLGYRGAFRYIKDPDVFKLELEAINKVRSRQKNLHLMIPFIRTVDELREVKNIVKDYKLFDDPKFKFYIMIEIPSNVILLEDFIKVGIDGVSIGSNDLTMLILGTDRDNEEVAGEFKELDKAVLWALEKTVKTASRYKILSSICGQAPSVYPELVQMLVNWGITAISINPDAIDITRRYIYEAEHRRIIG